MGDRPLYIFDLDGTLCDCERRKHHLANEADPDRWRKFYAACGLDSPILAVLATMRRLAVFADIWFWSGRSDEVRDLTIRWLMDYTDMDRIDVGNALRMRAAADHRPDDVLKAEWLASMSPADRERLVAVFEDRARVVAMWRAAGIPCFQVAAGDF